MNDQETITTAALETTQAADASTTSTVQEEVKDVPINAGGWAMLIVAWGAVLVLCVFCFKRLLSAPKPDAGAEK